MAENSDEQRAKTTRGRPFPPGQSGNPGGRPRELALIVNVARAFTNEALATLVACLDDASPRYRIAAAEALLNRGWGKPGDGTAEESDARARILQVQALGAERSAAEDKIRKSMDDPFSMMLDLKLRDAEDE